MKYFSLSELLFAIPASVLLGFIFALVYSFSVSFCRSVFEKSYLIKHNILFFLKNGKNNKAESKNVSKSLSFWACQLVSFFLIGLFGVAYSVFIYVSADGITRFYVLVLITLSFFFTKKIVNKHFTRINNFISTLFFEILSKVITVTIKLFLKVKAKILKLKDKFKIKLKK